MKALLTGFHILYHLSQYSKYFVRKVRYQFFRPRTENPCPAVAIPAYICEYIAQRPLAFGGCAFPPVSLGPAGDCPLEYAI